MMIYHADAPILDPNRPLLKIIVDWKIEAFASASLNPASTCRVETVEICDQKSTAGFQQTGHLRDGRLHVWSVDQREVANDEVEGIVVKWKTFSCGFDIRILRIACASSSKQRRRRINACNPYTMGFEHAAEATFATTYIKGLLG